eukprot:TRINITY_DN15521_c0_g2_i1.p1 TRINITY_DN15521_c0_g2~~TRINITY_DN15521_c0_g2_i1.p1  ORF type:complete len:499 (+),score=73.88 TRINITY_DN15521_c0_g2_i1:97-1593(+)
MPWQGRRGSAPVAAGGGLVGVVVALAARPGAPPHAARGWPPTSGAVRSTLPDSPRSPAAGTAPNPPRAGRPSEAELLHAAAKAAVTQPAHEALATPAAPARTVPPCLAAIDTGLPTAGALQCPTTSAHLLSPALGPPRLVVCHTDAPRTPPKKRTAWVSAYGAAWLASAPLFLGAPFPPPGFGPGRWGSGEEAGRIMHERAGVTFKTRPVTAFAVHHLSEYENFLMKRFPDRGPGCPHAPTAQQLQQGEDAAVVRFRETCTQAAALRAAALSAVCPVSPPPESRTRRALRTVAIMPWWGGKGASTVLHQVGSVSHGFTQTAVRLDYLRASACSTSAWFAGRTVIGVCGEQDRQRVLGALARPPAIRVMEVKDFGCSMGMELFGALMQHAKTHLAQWGASYVYYTEADQILYMRSVEQLYDSLSSRTYLAPVRLEERPLAFPTPRGLYKYNRTRPSGEPFHHFVDGRLLHANNVCLGLPGARSVPQPRPRWTPPPRRRR